MNNDRIQRIINQYDRALAGAEDATIARVNSALESSYRLLEQQLLKSYQKYQGETSLLPNQRKLLILQEIGTYLELLNPQRQQAIERDFENLLRGSYGDGLKLSEELVRAIGNEQLQSFASVNLAAVRFQAQDASKRLYRWSQDYQSKIGAIVEMHLATGAGPRKVASALRNELGIVKGRAEAIARTESLSSLNAAAQENYRSQGVRYVQVFGTADDRICVYCSARNGYVYKLGEISVPLHPSCRCFAAPFDLNHQKLGLTNDESIAQLRSQAIDELKKQGKEPNYGLAPFERSNKLAKPPTPVWKP